MIVDHLCWTNEVVGRVAVVNCLLLSDCRHLTAVELWLLTSCCCAFCCCQLVVVELLLLTGCL